MWNVELFAVLGIVFWTPTALSIYFNTCNIGWDYGFGSGIYNWPKIDSFFAKLKRFQDGDRVGQLVIMPYPQIEMEESDTLSDTERGEGGYGSTGN